MEFPERVYTQDEVNKARELIQKGYKHRLRVEGSQLFKDKMAQVLELVRVADYYGFLCTYIRQIVEIEGFSQLHEADAAVWANMSTLVEPVDAASYLVQKAQQMRDYLEGNLYYGTGEMAAIEKRLEFLNALKTKSSSEKIRRRSEELLKKWADAKMEFP